VLGLAWRDVLIFLGFLAGIVLIAYLAFLVIDRWHDMNPNRYPWYELRCRMGHRTAVELDVSSVENFDPSDLHCPICGVDIY